MPFSPDATANHLLDLSDRDSVPLTPLKLQKLMYFSHGWHLALSGLPLVSEELQAWEYGPVFPSTYQEFKEFGNTPIRGRAVEMRYESENEVVPFEPSLEAEATTSVEQELPFAKAVLDRVWTIYSPLPAMQLSEMSHEKGSPWWTVREKAKEKFGEKIPRGLNIPDELIREWFKKSRIGKWPRWLPLLTEFKLSDAVLMTLLGTTTANVVGLLFVVVRYLFPRRDHHGDRKPREKSPAKKNRRNLERKRQELR